MKMVKSLLLGAALASVLVSTSYAAPRKVAQVEQPNTLLCILTPITDAACPAVERLVGFGLYGAAIGTGVGSIWAAAGAGAVIGGAAGVVLPVALR